MKNPDSPDYSQDDLSEDLLIKMQSRTRAILDDVERITIEDEVDRNRVMKAGVFIENPTENLSDIRSNTTSIAHVVAGYMMQGAECPPEIDAMHGYLMALQCINLMKFIEEALVQGAFDQLVIQDAMIRGKGNAKNLSKAYNDDTFLNAFDELQDKLDNL